MEVPKDIKGREDRMRFRKLYGNLRPNNEVEIEMVKRHFAWLKHFEAERAVVERDGTTTLAGNGTECPSAHYKNMISAETEMRRLWSVLKDRMSEPQDDAEDVGQFKSL